MDINHTQPIILQEGKSSLEAEIDEAVITVRKLRHTWIVKPGENSNRGTGIFVTNQISDIKKKI
jgi:hypothetical protein